MNERRHLPVSGYTLLSQLNNSDMNKIITQNSQEIYIHIFLLALTSVTALRIVMMDVPSPVTAGESVELTCSYDLEGDRLYSVKYYKNG